MKKLKFTQDDKAKILASIAEQLNKSFRTKGIENFKIDDLKKDLSALPENIVQPNIYITTSAYVKMLELVRQSPIEISWHGLVKRDIEKQTYLIYDVLVFPQINSATTTTADEEGFAKWQTELISDMNFPIEDLRMHGHSHVNMQVFSSGVDDKYQEDLIHKVEDGDYYIFLIFNKKSDLCALLYDFDQNILFESDDIYMDVIDNDGSELCKWASYEIKENCKEETKVWPKATKSSSPSYWDGYYGGFYDEEYDFPIMGKKSKKKVVGGKKKNGSK